VRKWAAESSTSSGTVRWTPEAAADFTAIVEYILKQNPSAAERVAHTVYDGVASLA
jgi:plasmid stabilization system protein ParE